MLENVASIHFLQACAVLHTRQYRLEKEQAGETGKDLPVISCQRDALLAIPVDAYRKSADSIEKGFVEAGKFLNENKIIRRNDVPYPPQIVVLAATFAILGKTATNVAAKKKLSQWLWSVTFGELYGSSTETRIARDVPELVNWLQGGRRPQSIDEALFQQERLLTLRTRQSAAYKGLHALLMQNGCRDFITAREADIMTVFNDRIDIHHIFPQSWCKKQKIPPRRFNSIVNKTPLSRASNLEIGGKAPSVYLKRIEERRAIEADQLDWLLRSHLIEPDHLRNDDFDAFFEARMDSLTDIVAGAMKKPVVKERGEDEPGEDIGALDDEDFERQEEEGPDYG